MKQQLSIIIIPGLNDNKIVAHWSYRIVARHFKRCSLPSSLCYPGWNKAGSYEIRLQKLVHLIDKQATEGRQVVLAGVSAGAGLALVAYVARHTLVKGVVTVCGRINVDHADYSALSIQNKNYAVVSREWEKQKPQLTANELARILTIRPLWDEVIPPQLGKLNGAANKRILSIGHVLSIALALLCYSGTIRRFIQRLENVS